MEKIIPIRNKIAHGGYHDNIELILFEAKSIASESDENRKEYLATIGSLVANNIRDMYLNELMMATYLLLVYDKLLPIRQENEKKL